MRNSIGTPFVSEDPREQRKVDRINKKPWEQEVRDEKGRKRFHGAFTGGFSAGYFNTVGTKEGWNPKNFVATKDKRNKELSRNVMDYMDEEDINDQVGFHTITSKDVNKDFSFFEKQEEYQRKFVLPENSILLDQILPSYNSLIGNKLMIQAGYDETRRKSNIKDNCLVNTNQYFNGQLEFKDNYYGYGYVKEHNDSSYSSENKNTIKPNQNRIKMDKFEDDYDSGFYNSIDNSNFNYEIVEEEDRNTCNTTKINIDSMPKFIKSKHSLQSTNSLDFKMPELPHDYDPFKKKLDVPIKSTSIHSMNPETRSNLLEIEKNKYLKNKFTSVNDMIKKDEAGSCDINNSNKTNKPPSSIDQITNYFNFKIDIPFKEDLGKVSRFTKFIAEKEGLIISENYYGNSNLMTGNMIREERILFQQLYEDEQKLKRAEEALKMEIKNNNKIDKTSQSQEITKIKRERVKWRPEKLLCKRFKIKDPFENLIENKEDKPKGLSYLQNEILKEEARNRSNASSDSHHRANIFHKNITNHCSEADQSIKSINNEKNSFVIINANPDMNLFEEIFGN